MLNTLNIKNSKKKYSRHLNISFIFIFTSKFGGIIPGWLKYIFFILYFLFLYFITFRLYGSNTRTRRKYCSSRGDYMMANHKIGWILLYNLAIMSKGIYWGQAMLFWKRCSVPVDLQLSHRKVVCCKYFQCCWYNNLTTTQIKKKKTQLQQQQHQRKKSDL